MNGMATRKSFGGGADMFPVSREVLGKFAERGFEARGNHGLKSGRDEDGRPPHSRA